MTIKKLMSSTLLAALTMVSLNASAGNINATAARTAASNFLKQQASAKPGYFKATAMTDLQLSHAEPSKAVKGAVDYYVFNIKGGGFVIIAGEDRATQVIGYSDRGHIDVNNMPYNLKGLLDGYKQEIEFLQTYDGNDLTVAAPTLKAGTGVEPLIKTTWGQEMPYYLQCPVYQGEYCVVGCVATAMAQVMYYWQYPTSCNSISSYYCSDIRQTVQSLPATTFDYSKILPTYCHWDWDNSQLVQDEYTDEQAQEVAKLSRYCGQAVEMGYSPEGSGAYTSDQLAAMKQFGYSSNAKLVQKGGWYSNYSTAQWEALMKTELDAGRPILYSATDPSAGGHAFICDGYNSSNYFHFNLGWYGTCDGWYVSTTLSMVHRDGEQLNFNSSHQMLTGVEPPYYCIINAESVNAPSDLMFLGQSLNTEAVNLNMRTSYNTVNLVFAFTDDNDNRVCASNGVALNKSTFVQGSSAQGSITLPTTLQQGKYDLKLYYYTSNANDMTAINCTAGKLYVAGRMAKYNVPFDIDDVTYLIDIVLGKNGNNEMNVDIDDVTTLIDYILKN